MTARRQYGQLSLPDEAYFGVLQTQMMSPTQEVATENVPQKQGSVHRKHAGKEMEKFANCQFFGALNLQLLKGGEARRLRKGVLK